MDHAALHCRTPCESNDLGHHPRLRQRRMSARYTGGAWAVRSGSRWRPHWAAASTGPGGHTPTVAQELPQLTHALREPLGNIWISASTGPPCRAFLTSTHCNHRDCGGPLVGTQALNAS